ncbi:MAG TPA: glycerate kinase [Gaiellaceae bacterium]|nr:glycerate kinase [Gaiellaceae bacterium]
MSPAALACPASLKGCLSAAAAADALADGFDRAGVHADRLPVADGGEGTLDALCSVFEEVDTVDAFGRPRVARAGVRDDGTRVVEAAEAIPLDPSRLDVAAASSRGLGLWMARYRDCPLVVTIGGTATMDAGAGLLEVLDRLPGPTRVLCDVATTLYDAPRLFGPQKGATPEQVAELEARFRRDDRLAPFAALPGSGAAGGLGAALAFLGGELVPGADAVLDLLGFDPRGYDLVVTGEGAVDETTWQGKAPAAVVRRCAEAAVPSMVFGGRVTGTVPGTFRPQPELRALSGDPARAREDLVELGEELGRRLEA